MWDRKRLRSLAASLALVVFPNTLLSTEIGENGGSQMRGVSPPPDSQVAGVEGQESPAKVLHVTDESFSDDVLNENVPVLVKFWAEWAGPSKVMEPYLREIAADYAGRLKYVKLNIDENPEMTRKYGIRGIPTVILFVRGEPIATKVGALGKRQLAEWLDENLKE